VTNLLNAALVEMEAADKQRALGWVHVFDEKVSGTNGGNFVQGALRTRDLNTVGGDTIPGASLAANQLTLPAGEYKAWWNCPAYFVNRHQSLLYNTITGAQRDLNGNFCMGTSEFSGNGGAYAQTQSLGYAIFALSVVTPMELRHRCQTTFNNLGFGVPSGFGTPERYSNLLVVKTG
jgi:hypothetical protein